MAHALRLMLRLLALLAVGAVALQLWFVLRIAVMTVIDPQSTTLQRTQAARLLVRDGFLRWNQAWAPLDALGPHLPRAVIASEDDSFAQHGGLDWEAIRRARESNARAAQRAAGVARLRGGSTITQQLAKNLFLSGERTLPRKAQEAVITLMLEAVLGKRRILEIYLNSVEWGEGVFGAQAASEHYFRTTPARLDALRAAQLAVMLPAPRRFERNPHSAYVLGRAGIIASRMGGVRWPLPDPSSRP